MNNASLIPPPVLDTLREGCVIPAHPLALTSEGLFDEQHQRALARYYIAAEAGGLAVGVHTTQFEIHAPNVGLYEPVLTVAAEEMDRADTTREVPLVRVAGVVGKTRQAVCEAMLASEIGYHTALLSLGAMSDADENELISHCKAVSEILPIFGFYLQPAVGGRVLSYEFWRRFCEIDNVVAVKIAPFNRYQTLDVVRAVIDSGRVDMALYTGNDDNIVMDLVTPYRLERKGEIVERRIVGGLLGHWAVWTHAAARLFEECRTVARSGGPITPEFAAKAIETTDCNAALFDAANGFAGCIAGINHLLYEQGLLGSPRLMDPNEKMSPGQAEELERIRRAYPHLMDDQFIEQHRDEWVSG
jgi:hypothetical protein